MLIRSAKVVLVLFTRSPTRELISNSFFSNYHHGTCFIIFNPTNFFNLQGLLLDGTVIAVKQLSQKSKQGNREFVTEIGMISGLQHPNLVKLYGCCIEGNELLLVYEYMENNSLARALFGNSERHALQIFIYFFYFRQYMLY